MAKYAALTVRKLKPGSYDEWRAAWEGDPENWPKGVHAYILRNLNDPDEIIAFGLTDRSIDEIRAVGQAGAAGVIVGKGLYEGRVKLGEALAL